MNSEHRLRQEEQSETARTHEQSSETQTLEFGTVDDLLRFDSTHNPVPGEVAERLEKSVAAEKPAQRSWLKRFFG
jgi:hypothetical protein